MGRTLHYDITKPTDFTEDELDRVIAIQRFFNTGFNWTCENLDVYPISYYPNWEHWRKAGKEPTATVVWKQINARIKHWEKEGLHALAAIRAVAKEDLIYCEDDPRRIQGFTKTRGNEFNSLLVYQALLEVSAAIPEALIKLRDEGRFLFCPLQICNGQARPDMAEIHDDIQWRLASIAVDPVDKLLEGCPALDQMSDAVVKDLMPRNYKGTYGKENELKYLNERLADLAVVLPFYERAYVKHCLADPTRNAAFPPLFCTHNTARFFIDPHILHRPVNPEDFVEHHTEDHEIMSGFYGEHWGINTEDPEAESLKMLAKFQPLLTAANKKMPPKKRLTLALNVPVSKGR